MPVKGLPLDTSIAYRIKTGHDFFPSLVRQECIFQEL